MEISLKEELEKLYTQVSSATATTDFYNRVYKYISFIKQSDLIIDILNKDLNELVKDDKEKQKSLPKQYDNENDLDFFIKEINHTESGAQRFLNYYFLKIDRDIYYPLEWYYKENYKSEEAEIMLNGKKKESKLNFFKTRSLIDTDFNDFYINNFKYWKDYISNFHNILLIKLTASSSVSITEKETILELSENGTFRYINKTGRLNIKSKDYKLLYKLIYNKGYPVHYKEIIEHMYNKTDSKSARMDVNDLVKKLKIKLGILSGNNVKIIESMTSVGYYLNLKENEQAIIKP